jgi:hypothetical protein
LNDPFGQADMVMSIAHHLITHTTEGSSFCRRDSGIHVVCECSVDGKNIKNEYWVTTSVGATVRDQQNSF